MSRFISFGEEDIRQLEFIHVSTKVLKSGEVDTFAPAVGIEPGPHADALSRLRIHVKLDRRSIEGGTTELLSYTSLSIRIDGEGADVLKVTNEDGIGMDSELLEVIAYEAIEDTPVGSCYSDYRHGLKDSSGKPVPIGSTVTHVSIEENIPSPEEDMTVGI